MKARTIHYAVLRRVLNGEWDNAFDWALEALGRANVRRGFPASVEYEWERCYANLPHFVARAVTYG